MVFTTAQKVTKHLGYSCNKICCQEIPKIAQSGHTDDDDDGNDERREERKTGTDAKMN